MMVAEVVTTGKISGSQSILQNNVIMLRYKSISTVESFCVLTVSIFSACNTLQSKSIKKTSFSVSTKLKT